MENGMTHWGCTAELAWISQLCNGMLIEILIYTIKYNADVKEIQSEFFFLIPPTSV